MTENSILRQQARENLGGKIFAANWLWMLLACVIISAANTLAVNITLFIGGIGSIVIAGSVQYGIARLTTNLARGAEKPNLLDLTKGFTEGFGKIFLLGFMTGIFTMLWSLLFIIPGIVKSYSYAMAPYIMQDDPSKSWKQCIDESREMMNGHKAQLFWLDLSFIGWIIVGMLTFGIGMLFVNPYMHQARANFYLAVKEQAEIAE